MKVYHVPRWFEWQGPFIAKALKERRRRAEKALNEGREPRRIDAPLALTRFSADACIEETVAELESLGVRYPLDVLWRLLAHVAKNSGATGGLRVLSGRYFGVLVNRTGRSAQNALNALLQCGVLAEGEPVLPQHIARLMEPIRATTDAATHGTTKNEGMAPRMPRNARAFPDADPEESPPYPPGGGEPSAGASPGNGKPFRPRDRERFALVLDYVAQCGVLRERDSAVEIRKRLRDGEVTDDEIAEMLAGSFAWVTADRLKRWQGGAR